MPLFFILKKLHSKFLTNLHTQHNPDRRAQRKVFV